MSRILARICMLFAALTLVLALAPQAGAQLDESLDPLEGVDANADGAADVSVDRDPPQEGLRFISPDAQPSSDPAAAVGGTGGGDSSAGLAYTGVDVEPVMAASLGLLVLGGSMVVASRRLRDDA